MSRSYEDYYQEGLDWMRRHRPEELQEYVKIGQVSDEGQHLKANFFSLCIDLAIQHTGKEVDHATA